MRWISRNCNLGIQFYSDNDGISWISNFANLSQIFNSPCILKTRFGILYPKLLSSKFCFVYLLYLANSSWRDLNTKLPQMNIWIWYEGNTKVNLYQEQISEYLPADSIPSLLFKLAGNPRASKATWQSGGKGKKDQLALSGNKSRSF